MRAVVVIDDVVGPGFQRRVHQLVLVGARREDELPAMLEQKRDRAVGPEVAAVFGERMADVGDGANAVVGQAIDDHRGAVDAVALVADFLVVDAFELAGAALDRALDRVLGHVVGRGLVDREPQPRVGRDVAAAHAAPRR